MKKVKSIRAVSLSFMLMLSMVTGAMAAEVITAEDFKQGIIKTEHLVRTADNFIIMFDSSSSMAKAFKGTETSKYNALKNELAIRNEYLPDLGYIAGIYQYTPWKEIMPMGPYDQNVFAVSLEKLPPEPRGATLLQEGLSKLDAVLAGVSGRTAVFLFSDGSYSKFAGVTKPEDKIRELAGKYNVCFYIISSADSNREHMFLEELASVNECSRVIPFESYMDRPEYNSGALFVVKSTYDLITLSDQKVTGLKVEPVHFGFNEDFVKPQDFENLNQVGAFLNANPEAYAVLDGYSDNTGAFMYNMRLSRSRAESVAAYLMTSAGVKSDQLVVFWFGGVNPVGSNDTEEGQAKNRRVEIAVGGLK